MNPTTCSCARRDLTTCADCGLPIASSHNMTEVMKKVEAQIGGAIERLGSEGSKEGVLEKWLDAKAERLSVLVDLQHLFASQIQAAEQRGKNEAVKEIIGMAKQYKELRSDTHTPIVLSLEDLEAMLDKGAEGV
jgi:hypothetical protein